MIAALAARFAPAGVLAPKSKADFAFVLHALYYLSAKGRAETSREAGKIEEPTALSC